MQHYFPIGSQQPKVVRGGGQRIDARVEQLPSLKGMSLSLLELNPRAIREPHWHPNAHELSYCVEGTGLMTIFGHGNNHDTFTIEPGAIAFVPIGYTHHIENTGDVPLKMVLCFSHEDPEDLDLSRSVAVMPSHIMAETAGNTKLFYDKNTKNHDDTFIGEVKTKLAPTMPFMTNRYKMSLEDSAPQVSTLGGTVKMSNRFLMSTLDEISVYAVLLKPKGAREPHWHPNANELNYLTRGTARITLLSPNGDVETFDMKAGDMSFLPQGYIHYIENTGPDEAHFAIFFSNTAPSDIGLSGCFGAYSNEVLGASFNIEPSSFAEMPRHQRDVMVISGGG
jgi:oxalate decarboxylase